MDERIHAVIQGLIPSEWGSPLTSTEYSHRGGSICAAWRRSHCRNGNSTVTQWQNIDPIVLYGMSSPAHAAGPSNVRCEQKVMVEEIVNRKEIEVGTNLSPPANSELGFESRAT